MSDQIGDEIHRLAQRLFPICRSITGQGVRDSLQIIREVVPSLRVIEIPTGTRCFDWSIPAEWNIRGARLTGPDGEIVADFANSNLHVVGYSIPVDRELDLSELQPHLHSLPDQPDAIPYVTSYYAERWGFCLPHRQREALKPGRYHATIDSELKPGHLTLGEVVLKGEVDHEVFLSTYICHPSMANDQLSGPCVMAFLARWLASQPRRYTYRIVFLPETIGSIAYLSRNLDHLKKHVVAGFNVCCVGDDRAYSYLPSRDGNSLSDLVAKHVLHHVAPQYRTYTFLDRGSDERQYCAPGIDLPIASVMRTRYGDYPEYHTSLDDLSVVTPAGLEGGYMAVRRCIETLEADQSVKAAVLCEPQMGPRGLYSGTGGKSRAEAVRTRMDILAYADGSSLLEIANSLDKPVWDLLPYCDELRRHGLLEESRQ